MLDTLFHIMSFIVVSAAANLLDTLHRVIGSANLAYDPVIFLDLLTQLECL